MGGFFGGITIASTGFFLAMRDKRANSPASEDWSYGNAVGGGVLTALFATVLSAGFAYVYFAIINPDMSEVIVVTQLAEMDKNRLPPEQIDAVEPMIRKWLTPGMMMLMQLFIGFFLNVVATLIVAIFVRRRPRIVPAPLESAAV